jgi:hypothetical protein
LAQSGRAYLLAPGLAVCLGKIHLSTKICRSVGAQAPAPAISVRCPMKTDSENARTLRDTPRSQHRNSGWRRRSCGWASVCNAGNRTHRSASAAKHGRQAAHRSTHANDHDVSPVRRRPIAAGAIDAERRPQQVRQDLRWQWPLRIFAGRSTKPPGRADTGSKNLRGRSLLLQRFASSHTKRDLGRWSECRRFERANHVLARDHSYQLVIGPITGKLRLFRLTINWRTRVCRFDMHDGFGHHFSDRPSGPKLHIEDAALIREAVAPLLPRSYVRN